MSPFSTGKFVELNDAHSHFLLVDNGTVGRYGDEYREGNGDIGCTSDMEQR